MLFWTVLLFRIINVIDNIFNRYMFLFSYRLPDGFTMLLSLTHVYLNDTFLDFLPANIGRYVVLFDFIVNAIFWLISWTAGSISVNRWTASCTSETTVVNNQRKLCATKQDLVYSLNVATFTIKQFLANVLSLYPLKHQNSLVFWCVQRV